MSHETSNKIKESLERLRDEAIRKAHLGIAEKRTKVQAEFLNIILRNIQEGIRGPLAGKVAGANCRKILDQFLTAFQESFAELQSEIEAQAQPPGNIMTTEGEIMIYPEGCRFAKINPDSNTGIMVIEQAPQIRTILAYDKSGSHNTYHLAMPYVLFIVSYTMSEGGYHYSGFHVGFRTEPLESVSDFLHYPHLPNCSSTTVCMDSWKAPTGVKSPIVIANNLIGHFWQTRFSNVFNGFSIGAKKDGTIDTLEKWAELTEKNPLDILKGKFTRSGKMSLYLGAYIGNLGPQKYVRQLTQKMWAKISKEIDVDTTSTLVKETSQQILTEIIRDLTLQPQQPVVQ